MDDFKNVITQSGQGARALKHSSNAVIRTSRRFGRTQAMFKRIMGVQVRALMQVPPISRHWVAALSSAMLAGAATAQSLPVPPVSPAPVVKYEYDAEGYPTKTVVAPATRNLATQHDYDTLGRRKKTTDAKNGITQFGFDLIDQLTSVTDPRSLITQYQPTGLGDIKQLTSPDTGTATSTFDASGNVASRTDARGVLAVHSYDALNRAKQVVYSKSGSPNRTFSWTYDQVGEEFGAGVGRLTTATTPDGAIKFQYDALGRVTRTTQTTAQAISIVVKYGYDAAGRVTSITYPSGRTFNYTYVNGQLRSITKTAGAETAPMLDQIVMSALGQPESWVWTLQAPASPGRVYTRVYDTHGRMIRYPLGSLIRDVTYDDADRISRFTHYHASTGQASPNVDQTFSYDDLNRLVSVTGATNWSYTYDANGNRIASAASGTLRGHTVAAASNRLNALTNPARDMVYDAVGNTTSDIQSGAGTNYTATYSLEGRLASMSQGATSGVEFGYDALGRRVTRSQWTGSPANARTVTRYAYDQDNHLIGEYRDGVTIMEYVWLGDTPVAIMKLSGADVTAYAIHTDHLNTPRVIADVQGVTRWRWMMEPFGASPAEEQPTAGLPALQQSLRFPGQQYEPFGGRHYNHFRDYDPTTGRYVQSDPIGLDGGINTYAYANGNPLRFSDPYGLWGMDDVYGAVYDWTAGWEPSQGLVDFSAGWGDMLSFGITSQVRDGFGIGSVNKCSAFYKGGEAFGFVNGLALGWAQGTKAAAKAASGNNWSNFSHSLFPKSFLKKFDNQAATWMNKVGNRMNGDYVTPALHTRMDAAAQFGLTREWLAANPLFSPFRQLINRVPYVPGAAAYGAGSAAMNSCSCEN